LLDADLKIIFFETLKTMNQKCWYSN